MQFKEVSYICTDEVPRLFQNTGAQSLSRTYDKCLFQAFQECLTISVILMLKIMYWFQIYKSIILRNKFAYLIKIRDRQMRLLKLLK